MVTSTVEQLTVRFASRDFLFQNVEIEQLTVRFAPRDLLLQNVEIEELKQDLHEWILLQIASLLLKLNN